MKYIKTKFIEFINENRLENIIIPLDNFCYLNDTVYEPISVNTNLKQMLIKNFRSGDTETISFDEYYEYRHELGTPVCYFYHGREVNGEIVFRNNVKGISLYKDENYSGIQERFIIPTWSKVFKFIELN